MKPRLIVSTLTLQRELLGPLLFKLYINTRWHTVLYLCEYHGWFPPQRRWHLLFRGLADPLLHLWSHDAPAYEKHDPCNNVKNPAWSLAHQHLLHILIHCIFHDVMIWCIMYDVQFNRTFKCVVISSLYHQYLKKLHLNMGPDPLSPHF